MGLVKDLLHWLLKYLSVRNIRDLFDNRFTSVWRYWGLQRFSNPVHLMKTSSWQGKEIWSMISTLAPNCPPILDCIKDDGKAPPATASDGMVVGAVLALCEFTLLGSKQKHSDISLTALDDALKRFYKKKGAFGDQKTVKSVKAKVNKQLGRESHQLGERKNHIIYSAIEVQVYRAQKVTTSKCSQFKVRLNKAGQEQQNGLRLNARGQSSDRTAKSIRWLLYYASFWISYSNIMSDNYSKESGLRQSVTEAHSSITLLKWRLLPKKMFTGS